MKKKLTPVTIWSKTIAIIVGVFILFEGTIFLWGWGSGKIVSDEQWASLLNLHQAFRWITAIFVGIVFIISLCYLLSVTRYAFSYLADIVGVTSNISEREREKAEAAVEEMVELSGLDCPDVRICDLPGCLNAFTALNGDEPCIFLTKDIVRLLDDFSLTAVIAHEFAHIKNGDTDRFKPSSRLLFLALRSRIEQRLLLPSLRLLFLPILWSLVVIILAVLAFVNPIGMGTLLIAVGCLSAAAVLFMFAAIPRPVYASELTLTPDGSIAPGRFVRSRGVADVWQPEFTADREAVGWTEDPGALAHALQEVYGFSYFKRLKLVNSIAFAPTRFYNSNLRKVSSRPARPFMRGSIIGKRIPPAPVELRLEEIAKMGG